MRVHRAQRGMIARDQGGGRRIAPCVIRHRPVDCQMPVPALGPCPSGPRGLRQRVCPRSGHEDQPHVRAVRQSVHRRCMARALLLQPRQRPEAGGIASRFRKSAPGAGQFPHADRVAAGRRVKDDKIMRPCHRRAGQQGGEFVKGRDFGGARTRPCPSIPLSTVSGRTPRIGVTIRSRYAAAAPPGSISSVVTPGTAAMVVIRFPISTPNTWPTFDAGSVETNKTRRPASARQTAIAQASEVLPTPPLPLRKTNFCESLNRASSWATGARRANSVLRAAPHRNVRFTLDQARPFPPKRAEFVASSAICRAGAPLWHHPQGLAGVAVSGLFRRNWKSIRRNAAGQNGDR